MVVVLHPPSSWCSSCGAQGCRARRKMRSKESGCFADGILKGKCQALKWSPGFRMAGSTSVVFHARIIPAQVSNELQNAAH